MPKEVITSTEFQKSTGRSDDVAFELQKQALDEHYRSDPAQFPGYAQMAREEAEKKSWVQENLEVSWGSWVAEEKPDYISLRVVDHYLDQLPLQDLVATFRLKRDDVNRLIRVLRKARDRTFSPDA